MTTQQHLSPKSSFIPYADALDYPLPADLPENPTRPTIAEQAGMAYEDKQ